VRQSADILSAMGAAVTVHRYEGRSHTVSRDELDLARQLLLRAFFAPD